MWKSQGDQQIRKYDFSYDAVNRLTGADFNQYNSGFNKNDKVDFSVSNLTYDANGNILTMDQKGLKVSGSDYIDKLRYTYLKNGNRLQNVMDITNDPDTKLADFRYSAQHDQKATKDAYAQNQTAVDATTVTDYTYDDNGNLDIDKNKNISAISYNVLNLAQTVTVTNKGTITYVYDAAGIKWQKIVSEPNASVSYKGASYTSDITTTTNYLGGFVYESKVYSNTALSELGYTDRLQYIAHEEGRIRYIAAEGTTAAHFEYDYFVKDHLGNVRMMLTEEQKQDIYPAATLEGSLANSTDAVYTESQYYSINEANIVNKSDVLGITDYKNKNGGDAATDPPVNPNPNSNVTANSAKLYKLKATGAANGGVTGLGTTLKVMSGDYIDVYGKSYYNLNNTDGSNKLL